MALFGPINPEPQQYMLKGMSNVEQLQKEHLQNALLQIQKQYMPGMQEAEIGLKHGQEFENRGRGTNYFAEATTAPSKIGLNNAHSGYYNAMTKLMPEEMALKQKQLQQQTSRFGSAYQMAKMLGAMPTAARATWIAQNQEAYAGMMAELGNQSPSQANAPLAQPTAGTPAPINALTQPAQQPGAQPPANALAQGMPQPQAAPAATSPRFSPSTPEQIAQLQQANNMAANASLTTAGTRRQMEGAIQVENIINDPSVQSQAVNASQYAGAARKGKAALDALSQQNPAAYEDYLAFKNQTMVLLQNRIKTLDQMGATDKQRDELQGLYNKTMDSLTSNPGQFITQFNKLGGTLDTISQSVQKSASPIANVNRLGGFKGIKEGDGRVSIVSPDGSTGSIPASQLQEAIKAGYKEG